MKTVLFVIGHYQHLREIYPVLVFFSQQDSKTHVLFCWDDEHSQNAALHMKSLGIETHFFSELYRPAKVPRPAVQADKPTDKPIYEKKAPGHGMLRRNINFIAEFILCSREVLRLKHVANKFLDRINPDTVISAAYYSCAQIYDIIFDYTKKHDIPHHCFCWHPFIGQKQQMFGRFGSIRGHGWEYLNADYCFFTKILAKLFPDWTRTDGNKRIFPFRPSHLLTAFCNKLLPSNIWQTPHEDFDLLFVESQFAMDQLQESNFDTRQTRIVGKPLLDAVFLNLNNQEHLRSMCAAVGLDPDTPFLLLNMLPVPEHKSVTNARYWEDVANLCTQLGKLPIKFVVSLHPRCRPEDYEDLLLKNGMLLARQHKLHDLYPYCMAVVTHHCSTNPMAYIFNKPLILYDFHKYTTSYLGDFITQGLTYSSTIEKLSCEIQSFLSSHALASPSQFHYKNASQRACETIHALCRAWKG